MANSFQTGSTEMLQAVKTMEEVNQAMLGNLKTLQQEVEQVAPTWQGAAASAFTTLMAKFDEDAAKLNRDLGQIAEAVTGNAKAYQAQEDTTNSQMTQILGGLG
ncbi:MAG TPA: WXG100 family type VII secretion target [Pseudonocardiaceae bacterium]|jgi:WXG100 family type VII secretion target|nr:WXG100 family type VII secretion target [Pseudonocardiaceae bacterium]